MNEIFEIGVVYLIKIVPNLNFRMVTPPFGTISELLGSIQYILYILFLYTLYTYIFYKLFLDAS